MINTDEIYVTHYSHPTCTPFMNICRLPKAEAFKLASQMAEKGAGVASFDRFDDTHFDGYYTRRMATDKILRDTFIAKGGKPKEMHPIFFVLHSSKSLEDWMGDYSAHRIKLNDIPSDSISFTVDDSILIYKKHGVYTMYTKEKLIETLTQYPGTMEDYLRKLNKEHYCIEAQLWNDDYLNTVIP
ncbi:MAG: hypothetical protein FWB80_09010 [Defluviitaleaceae bacterium]|nr:hypothetical protein [Defluviitaleaceae bacterium]